MLNLEKKKKKLKGTSNELERVYKSSSAVFERTNVSTNLWED